jgi:hypothetical protein
MPENRAIPFSPTAGKSEPAPIAANILNSARRVSITSFPSVEMDERSKRTREAYYEDVAEKVTRWLREDRKKPKKRQHLTL